jgi:hypothetical protein
LKLPDQRTRHDVFNNGCLKRFYPLAFPNHPQVPSQPDPMIEEENGPEYEVAKVVGKRNMETSIEYLVRWKNYGPEDDTWEPVAGLSKARKVVRDFESQG